MCPNCILNETAGWAYLGPGLICLVFAGLAYLVIHEAKKTGEFTGDEEEVKHQIFDD